jgi:hypothetical protein
MTTKAEDVRNQVADWRAGVNDDVTEKMFNEYADLLDQWAKGEAVGEVISNSSGQVYLQWFGKKTIADFSGCMIYANSAPPQADLIEQQAKGEPIGYFMFDRRDVIQVDESYKEESDVFPLYTHPSPDQADQPLHTMIGHDASEGCCGCWDIDTEQLSARCNECGMVRDIGDFLNESDKAEPTDQQAKGEPCRECGSTDTTWECTPVNNSEAVDGRICMREVGVRFFLACNECSETLEVLNADAFMNRFNTQPSPAQAEPVSTSDEQKMRELVREWESESLRVRSNDVDYCRGVQDCAGDLLLLLDAME